MTIKFTKFGQVTWVETLGLCLQILIVPLIIVQEILYLPFRNRHGKTRKRYILDALVRRSAKPLNAVQIQKLMGPNERTYMLWAWITGSKPFVETVPASPAGKRILWMGERPQQHSKTQHSRVIVYLHGGGFVIPMQAYCLPFFHYVQKQVSESLMQATGGCSIAIPEYTLATEAPWPASLRDTAIAIQHLLDTGISPTDIILVGDSAGSNLVYQVLQHALHPNQAPSVPPLVARSEKHGSSIPKFAGAFFISPWFDLEGRCASFRGRIQAKVDMAPEELLLHCGHISLSSIGPSHAEEGRRWLLGQLSPVGLENVVERVLIFAGGQERLRDDILRFADEAEAAFAQAGKGDRVKLIVERFGVHDDLFLQMVVEGRNESVDGAVRWLSDSFEKSKWLEC